MKDSREAVERDSLRLALDAERANHVRNNEHLITERDKIAAERLEYAKELIWEFDRNTQARTTKQVEKRNAILIRARKLVKGK